MASGRGSAGHMWLMHVYSKNYVGILTASIGRLLLLVIELQITAGVADNERIASAIDRHAGDALRLLFVFKRHQFDRRRALTIPLPEPEILPWRAFRDA